MSQCENRNSPNKSDSVSPSRLQLKRSGPAHRARGRRRRGNNNNHKGTVRPNRFLRKTMTVSSPPASTAVGSTAVGRPTGARAPDGGGRGRKQFCFVCWTRQEQSSSLTCHGGYQSGGRGRSSGSVLSGGRGRSSPAVDEAGAVQRWTRQEQRECRGRDCVVSMVAGL